MWQLLILPIVMQHVVISAQPETVFTVQTTLRNTYDEMQEKHYHDILRTFDSCESTNAFHNARKLVKQNHLHTRGRSFGCLENLLQTTALQIIREHPTIHLIQILALRRIIEEMRNHQKEAAIISLTSRKPLTL